jgi:bidirectional [NiFe] hydrogenase diaphorase subunit
MPGVIPTTDPRWTQLDAVLKRQQFRQDALIEVLHAAQRLFGRLDPALLRSVARALKLPPSRVYGVATFYHLFTFAEPADHTCVVCVGTACYIEDADGIVARLEQTLDGRVAAVHTARCLGACGVAPVVVFDGRMAGRVTPDAAAETVKGWRGGPD